MSSEAVETQTPAGGPLRVACRRWQQAGYDVYSAPCPLCQPTVRLDAPVQQLHVHLNGEGRVVCRCGAYLELYFPV